MFDKLIDMVAQLGSKLRVCTVIDSYEEGVIMRLGNCRKVVTSENGMFGTGLHWMLPVLETDITEHIKPRVASYKGRSLTTKDGKQVVLGITMTYRIHNIRKALLEVYDVNNSLDDVGQLVAARTVPEFEYNQLTGEEFSKALLSNARERGFKFGVEIMDIGLSELAVARTIRLVEGT